MSIFRVLFILYLTSIAAACSKGAPPVDLLVAEDGTKYEMVSKQNIIFEGDKMLVLTYISKNPGDKTIRNKEFQDLYQITADNINLESDYAYIALVAMEKRNKTFGVTKNSGYRDRRKFSDVIALRKSS